jgi:SAM-dependent methyltransferase
LSVTGIAHLGEMEQYLEDTHLADLHELETVVEIGAGRAPIATLLNPRPARLISIGPEDNAEAFDVVIRGTAERLPLESGSVDLIVARWVLEHVSDANATASEIARVLRPGGRFVFITPNQRHWLFAANGIFQRLVPFRLMRFAVALFAQRPQADVYQASYALSSVAELDRSFGPFGTVQVQALPGSAYGLRLGRFPKILTPGRLPFLVGCFVKR